MILANKALIAKHVGNSVTTWLAGTNLAMLGGVGDFNLHVSWTLHVLISS